MQADVLSGKRQDGERGQNSDGGEVLSTGDNNRSALEPGDEPQLSDAEIFEILRNSKRRTVITHLLENAGQAPLTEVVDHVAAKEYETTPGNVSPEHRKLIYTGLYQCHLPRLDEFNVIDFDKETKAVTLHDTAHQVEDVLRRGSESADGRGKVALAITVAVLSTLGVLGVGPVGAVPVVWWAILTATTLFGMALFELPGTDRR